VENFSGKNAVKCLQTVMTDTKHIQAIKNKMVTVKKQFSAKDIKGDALSFFIVNNEKITIYYFYL